jgi:hypothetical protein
MRSIVKGMGLDWKSQFVKLKQRFVNGIVEITIVASDGKELRITNRNSLITVFIFLFCYAQKKMIF